MHKLSIKARFQAIEAKVERLAFLEREFPGIASQARIDLLFACLYQGQLAILDDDKAAAREVIALLKSTIKTHPLYAADKKQMKHTHRIWAFMGERAFTLTCGIRNAIGVGR